MSHSSLKPGKPMKRTPMTRIKPLSGILRTAKLPAKAKPTKRLKSTHRAVTAAERVFWHDMAGLGCLACRIDGRTKPGCHALVLPLCAQHHQQDDTDPLERVAVHPNKARFEALYGTQYELLADAKQRLGIA
jgi:hypothetical protein